MANIATFQQPADERLRGHLRAARCAESEHLGAIVALRDSSSIRLALLRDELAPILSDTSAAKAFIDLVLIAGDCPRLWIDMTSYVVMAPDPRTYRLHRDTLDCRETVAETADLAEMTEAILKYVAHRMIQREHFMLSAQRLERSNLARRFRTEIAVALVGFATGAAFASFMPLLFRY